MAQLIVVHVLVLNITIQSVEKKNQKGMKQPLIMTSLLVQSQNTLLGSHVDVNALPSIVINVKEGGKFMMAPIKLPLVLATN